MSDTDSSGTEKGGNKVYFEKRLFSKKARAGVIMIFVLHLILFLALKFVLGASVGEAAIISGAMFCFAMVVVVVGSLTMAPYVYQVDSSCSTNTDTKQ